MCNKISIFFYILIAGLLLTNCQSADNSSKIDSEEEFTLSEYTVKQMQNKYSTGELTVVEVVKAYLNRIEAIDKNGPGLNSIIQVNPDALEIASQLDQCQ